MRLSPHDLAWLAKLVTGREDALVAYPAAGEEEAAPGSLVVTDDAALFARLAARVPRPLALLDAPGRAPGVAGSHRFHYVRNPDGTLRWLFREGLAHPIHLALYNAGTARARVYRALTRIAFRVGRGDLVAAGSLSATFSEVDLLAPHLPAGFRWEQAALFAGTRGEDRKVLVALGRRGAVSHFLKIPLGAGTRALLENERGTLRRLAASPFPALRVPAVERGPRGALLLGSVAPRRPRPASARLSAAHLDFVAGSSARFGARAPLGDTSFYTAIRQGLERAEAALAAPPPGGDRLPPAAAARLALAMRRAFEALPRRREIPVSLAHGDFAPWNVFVAPDGLRLYDWELACPDAPALYDAYHFVCQSGVLVGRARPAAVLRRLERLRGSGPLGELERRLSVDGDLHLRLYLLHKSAHYLARYAATSDLHLQAAWLVEFWTHALEVSAPPSSAEPRLRLEPASAA